MYMQWLVHLYRSAVSSVGYAILLRLWIVEAVLAILLTVLVDCIGSGVVVASVMW